MNEKIIYNSIIVNNGIKEYDMQDIYSNQQIRSLVNTVIGFAGLINLAEQVNKVGGILYINSNINFTLGSAELKNVSNEILENYEKTRA
jgi:ABC-type transporter lipoprotein component MlaA